MIDTTKYKVVIFLEDSKHKSHCELRFLPTQYSFKFFESIRHSCSFNTFHRFRGTAGPSLKRVFLLHKQPDVGPLLKISQERSYNIQI